MQNISSIKHKNRILKYFFLLSGIFVLISIFLPYFKKNTPTPETTIDNDKKSKSLKNFNLSIINSIFQGVNKDNLPYTILAKAVTQENNGIYNLKSINFGYQILSGDIKILAEDGMLNEDTKTFILSKNVKIKFKELVLTSDQINFNIKTNSAICDSPVEVNFNNSKINASSFVANDSGNIVNFEGNVISNFDKELTKSGYGFNIKSDFLKINNNDSSANFSGSVTVIYDDVIIKTNNIIVYYTIINNKQSVAKIIITDPLKAIKSKDNEIILADKAEYLANSNELIFTGNVAINKDDKIVITDKLVYITKLKTAPELTNNLINPTYDK